MYAIMAHRTTVLANGWVSNRSIPTFYLDENVQGIIGEEHAKMIAHSILDTGDANITYEITACKVD